MVGRGVTICKFRYSRSRNMNWALDRRGGGCLSLSPPTSFRKPDSHCIYRDLGKGSRRQKGGLTSAPRKPGAGLVGPERGNGKETGWAAMPACANKSTGHPDDPSQAPWLLETILSLGLPPPQWQGGESSLSGHPPLPECLFYASPNSSRVTRYAGLCDPRSGFQS